MCSIAVSLWPAGLVPIAVVLSMAAFAWTIDARWWAKILIVLSVGYAALPLTGLIAESWWFHVNRDSTCSIISKGPGADWHWYLLAIFFAALPWALRAGYRLLRPQAA